jgi:FixJ family two-component response regulator
MTLDAMIRTTENFLNDLKTMQSQSSTSRALAERRRKWKTASGRLTDKGRAKVRQKIAEGWSNPRIAGLLDITTTGVRRYR